ncbi:MAG: type II toxin-antitoxin system PemK/MazF family toxin [Eubacteriales bacterium]|nr:type II toxin-antitoxin system PemK/MazF family toxin [Eubacteriales bacterium]
MTRNVQRGDIYYANLNPVVGSEEGGERPVLILSNNVGNRYGTTIIVAPITSWKNNRNLLPTQYRLDRIEGLPKRSVVLLEQIRTIDKKRLYRWIARLDTQQMKFMTTPLLISAGIKRNRGRRNTCLKKKWEN